MPLEYALAIARPSAVRRALVGEILGRFERKGLKLVDISLVYMDEEMVEALYPDKVDIPDFPALVLLMTSGPSVPMLFQGERGSEVLRQVLGKKSPVDSPPGSIRGDFAIDQTDTVCHGARTAAESISEASLFFPTRFK
jgi:nucleoside-diphosphate kinase